MTTIKKLTQEQIIIGILSHFNDLEFVERVNDITYHQKVKLKKHKIIGETNSL